MTSLEKQTGEHTERYLQSAQPKGAMTAGTYPRAKGGQKITPPRRRWERISEGNKNPRPEEYTNAS